MLLLLLACSAPEDDAPDDLGDSAAETDAPDTDTGPCEVTIAVMGQLVPGAVVEIWGGPDVTWSVSAGTLSAPTGERVEWTLPTDIAIDEAETLTVTAEGCETRTYDVQVDWPLADRTVVLYNPSIAGSEDVARYYAAFRGIDDAGLCAIAAPDSTTLAGADADAFLDAAQACMDARGPQAYYLVPVYGVPYKVSGRIIDFYTGDLATVSLDALLVYGSDAKPLTEVTDNQVYRRGSSIDGDYNAYKPFGQTRHNLHSRYHLVARIDGADAQSAMDLVDRTEAAEVLAAAGALAGIVYTDGNLGDTPPATDVCCGYEWGEWNMWGTRRVFEDHGVYEVVWDGNPEEFGTAPAPLACPDALYYAGWYSFNNYNDAFTWAPGAIGGHLDSCSACDLRNTTWAAEALKRGITATFGAVNEPYVTGMPEYDQLFLYLLQGATYGEAAYQSTIVGAWMMVFVGDPLYRPYPQ